MKIAYLILAHKSPRQVQRLINAVSNNDSMCFIHLDQKCDAASFKKQITQEQNTHYLANRYNIRWGGFNMVKATLSGLNEIVSLGYQFDYIFLLSGQDYPLKSNKQIASFLSEHRGHEFIDCTDIENIGWYDAINRLRNYHFFDLTDNRAILNLLHKANGLIPCKRLPQEIDFYGGSQWWTFSYSFVKYILDYTSTNPKLLSVFRTARVPDEMFFQTVIMNSPFSRNVKNYNLRHIDWNGADKSHPRVLSVQDLDDLANSPALFARKFDICQDDVILDRLDDLRG